MRLEECESQLWRIHLNVHMSLWDSLCRLVERKHKITVYFVNAKWYHFKINVSLLSVENFFDMLIPCLLYQSFSNVRIDSFVNCKMTASNPVIWEMEGGLIEEEGIRPKSRDSSRYLLVVLMFSGILDPIGPTILCVPLVSPGSIFYIYASIISIQFRRLRTCSNGLHRFVFLNDKLDSVGHGSFDMSGRELKIYIECTRLLDDVTSRWSVTWQAYWTGKLLRGDGRGQF
jgi:hypothetical protein